MQTSRPDSCLTDVREVPQFSADEIQRTTLMLSNLTRSAGDREC